MSRTQYGRMYHGQQQKVSQIIHPVNPLKWRQNIYNRLPKTKRLRPLAAWRHLSGRKSRTDKFETFLTASTMCWRVVIYYSNLPCRCRINRIKMTRVRCKHNRKQTDTANQDPCRLFICKWKVASLTRAFDTLRNYTLKNCNKRTFQNAPSDEIRATLHVSVANAI